MQYQAISQGAPAVPHYALNDCPSYRPWRYPANPDPDGWWSKTLDSTGLSNVGKKNCLADCVALAARAKKGSLRLRIEFPWRFMEPVSQYTYDWTQSDFIVNQCMLNGFVVHAIIVFTPAWIGGPTALPSAQQMKAFAQAFANRYCVWSRTGGVQGGPYGVRIIEAWNEPDLSNYGGYSVAQYTSNVLNPLHDGVKAVDPNALVVSAGTSSLNTAWIAGLASNGATFDVQGFHEYPGSFAQLNSDFNSARSQLTTSFSASVPLWLDETGVLDSGGNNIASWVNGIFPFGSQSPDAPSKAIYTVRDNNSSTGEDTTTSPLTNGVLVNSIAVTGLANLPTMASGSSVCLVDFDGSGNPHFEELTTTGQYNAGGTSVPVSFTPNYSYATGALLESVVDAAHAPQPYGLLDRGLSAKGTAASTFDGFTH